MAAEAATHGITDLAAALAAVDSNTVQSAAAFTREVSVACFLGQNMIFFAFSLGTKAQVSLAWLFAHPRAAHGFIWAPSVPSSRPASYVPSTEAFCPWALLLQAKYVELLVQLRSQQQLRQEKAGLSLLGSQGVQLHAEGSNSKREEQLQKACAKLEQDLGIRLG